MAYPSSEHSATARKACRAPRVRLRRSIGGKRGGQSGQVFVIIAMALVGLLGFAAMALDVGFLWAIRRQMQTAADAAAIAGAREIALKQTDVTAAAQGDASENGFTNGANNVTVTVKNPPATGSYAGAWDGVEAIVSQKEPTFFLGALGIKSVNLSARAVAHLSSGLDCIYALNGSASNALVASGSASIDAGCGVVVDSRSSSALVVSGGACISAKSIGVVGNYNNSSSCPLTPDPETGIDSVSDPLANLSPPSVGGCNYTNFSLKSGTATLNPGVYCNGITVSASGTTAILNPGTYILDGGGLTVSGGANIQGTGVSFYNTQGAASYKPIVVSGGSSTTLSAPTSGSLAGILFFQDRSIKSSSQNTVSGGSTAGFEGTLYFPTTPLVYSGGSSTSAAYTVIIADTITFSGSSNINNNYSSLAGGSPVKGAAVLGE
jgi:Flp pilus assembly protein TadG